MTGDGDLIPGTKRKLDETTKLIDELLETVEILGDPDMMYSIRKGYEDVEARRVKPLREILKEEAHWLL